MSDRDLPSVRSSHLVRPPTGVREVVTAFDSSDGLLLCEVSKLIVKVAKTTCVKTC